MNNAEPDPRVGSRFGPYQLMRSLHRSGVGEDYAAEDTRTQRVVALKLIPEQLSGNTVFRKRMEHGAEAVGQLTEPHVLPVDDRGEIDGLMFLETRLIDGTDLATMLKTGPLSPPRAVAIVHQIATALDAADAGGVTHGAVKPENILVTDDDYAYLVDFGIASAAEEVEPGHNGDEASYPDDVYALSCVLAECLTGSPPGSAAPPRPSRLRPGRVPPALDEVVARGLSRDPRDRYTSAGHLATAAYEALTRPERHQATRILRRGGSAAPSAPPGTGRTPLAAVRDVESSPKRLFAPTPAPKLAARRPKRSIPGLARLRRRQKQILAGVAALAVVALVVAVGYQLTQASGDTSAAAPRQEVLPFHDLGFRLAPGGVAVDTDGDVYVTSQGVSGRVVKLPGGSTTPTVLPSGDLYQPQGVVVDSHGNVYFSDFNNRVVRMDAGSDAQTVLPFVGLDSPAGIAVDASGNVYVADRGNNQVVRLDAASNTQTVLAFTGLRNPSGVAVDSSGAVYVTDTDNNRVSKLASGSADPIVLPFGGIAQPWGIAVDDSGDVYVTEHRSNKVAKLATGAAIPAVLAFTGLNAPSDVAIDRSGNVYVADRGNDRVVKLPG